MYYQQPQINDIYNGMSITSPTISFNWDKMSDAEKYVVILKDADYNYVTSFETKATTATIDAKDLKINKKYSILVGSVINDYTTVFSDPVEIYYGSDKEIINVETSLYDK